MTDYIIAIVKMLYVIHHENMILFSVLTGEDENGINIKNMREVFNEAMKGVLKE